VAYEDNKNAIDAINLAFFDDVISEEQRNLRLIDAGMDMGDIRTYDKWGWPDEPVDFTMCAFCKHLTPDARSAWKCRAFPGGIPAAIVEGRFDHRERYPGDGGHLFVMDPEMKDAAPHHLRESEDDKDQDAF